jgi:hypothetical protein
LNAVPMEIPLVHLTPVAKLLGIPLVWRSGPLCLMTILMWHMAA